MKRVDTQEYVSTLRALAEEGHEVSMLIAGSSMTPFLCHLRDRIFFAVPDRPLRRGDMVFYRRASGQYVMHRIYKVKKDSYYIVGDAQTQVEGPVSREQIFARITRVERKGKLISEGDFWWNFFAGVWLTLRPLRPFLVGVYGRCKAILHRA